MADKCFRNPGLCHIGENILKNLSFEDKLTCRLVQKSWKNILDKFKPKDQDIGLNDLLQGLHTELELTLENFPHSEYFQQRLGKRYAKWAKILTQIFTEFENPWIAVHIQNLYKKLKASNQNLISPLNALEIVFGNAKMEKFTTGSESLNYCFSVMLLLNNILEKGCFDFMKCLKPCLTQEDQEYVILKAIQMGSLKFLELIIQPDTYLDYDFLYRNHFVHQAAQKGYMEIVEFLLCHTQYFATDKDGYGNTPLFYAVENNDMKTVKVIVEYLIEHKLSEDFSSFHLAAKNGYYEVLKYLCDNVSNPNVPGRNGDTVMHCAVRNGQFEIVKLMSFFISDVNVTNDHGVTPIIIAKLNGYSEIAKYLQQMAEENQSLCKY